MSAEWSICSVCGSTIFIADIEQDGTLVWSHIEEGCDDPVPNSLTAPTERTKVKT